jgi:hypothetical protein
MRTSRYGAWGRGCARPRLPRRRGVALAATAVFLSGCGAVGVVDNQSVVDHVSGSGCTTTVHSVVPGPGSLAATWLPPGFQLTGGSPSDLTSTPVATYASTSEGADPPRIQLNFSNSPAPLNPGDGGRTTATPIEVQGHAGLLESGPPDPQFVGAYWKPTTEDLLSVVGYKVPASVVVQVAQHLAFSPPGTVSLPVASGPIVTRSTAIGVAKRAVQFPVASATAKLSSWTEAMALLQASQDGADTSTVPSSVSTAPWEPIWVVLIVSSSKSAPTRELVVVNGASGRPELTTPAGSRSTWFVALTDRDPSVGGCPGGSSTRLPFGILTRDEEGYTARATTSPGAAGDTTSTILKLTTVPVLNRDDPGLYGGCLRQSCSLDELVWPTIAVIHAPSGKTLACLPDWASYPPGYQPKQVKQYVTISVPGNSEIDCGSLPRWVNQLKDLAPPAVS